MNFLDAMTAVRTGQPMRRPHWAKLMIIWDMLGARAMLDEEDGPIKKYKPVRADRKAIDWVPVDMTNFNRPPEAAVESILNQNLNETVTYKEVP